MYNAMRIAIVALMLAACGVDRSIGTTHQENGVGNVCWLSTCQPIHCTVPPGGTLHCEENYWADVDCDALCGGICTIANNARIDACGNYRPDQACYGQTGINADFCVANCVNSITTACSPIVAEP